MCSKKSKQGGRPGSDDRRGGKGRREGGRGRGVDYSMDNEPNYEDMTTAYTFIVLDLV